MPAPSPHRRGAAALTVALTVALTAALALAPLAGGGDAAGVAASQAAGTATGRTAVTVVVRRCRSCTIQPVRYVPSDGADPWWGPVRHLDSARQVTLHLPTARTHGLTFFVDAPWHGADDVAALAALRYRGRSPGDAVTAADARTTHRATPCWAGTDQPAARIVIRVDRFPTRTAFTGQRTHHPRAYAPRTLETWPPMARAYRGSLGARTPTPARHRPRLSHPAPDGVAAPATSLGSSSAPVAARPASSPWPNGLPSPGVRGAPAPARSSTAGSGSRSRPAAPTACRSR